ncbi:GM14189 [Drosophila sechellia]|uniref:GM14189 n=2 Tax=melanogaster subgroup TaxID=32351 RepID=B4HVX6_DROSE|nr:GM14189 [Drosophila sechellia]
MLEQLKSGIAAKAKQKIKIMEKDPAKEGSEPLVAALADSSLVDAIVSKVSTATVAAAESAARRSRSRDRRSRSKRRTSTSHHRHDSSSESRSRYSTSSSRTGSHSSRSGSHSSRSSCSSNSSSGSSSSGSGSGSSQSGSRSPSIPRRRGSPSFLDRRRITSARKRPIPYHHKANAEGEVEEASSCCSSCFSRASSPATPLLTPLRNSRSPSMVAF